MMSLGWVLEVRHIVYGDIWYELSGMKDNLQRNVTGKYYLIVALQHCWHSTIYWHPPTVVAPQNSLLFRTTKVKCCTVFFFFKSVCEDSLQGLGCFSRLHCWMFKWLWKTPLPTLVWLWNQKSWVWHFRTFQKKKKKKTIQHRYPFHVEVGRVC